MSIPRILIVDDQRDIIRLIHATLDSLGHDLEIVEAPSGEEALLEATQNKKLDMLVSDYKLPGITGVELMAKVRKRHPDVKTILITAMTDKKTREDMRSAGATALFEKPIPLADFLDVVERELGLDRTILIEENDVVEDDKSLSTLLTTLRKQIDAHAVLLISERGRVLVRAGELKDSSMEVSLLSTLVNILSVSQKVSRVIHQEKFHNLHIFKDGDQDIVLAPVDYSHALLIAGDDIARYENLTERLLPLEEYRENIKKELKSLGVTSREPDADGEESSQPENISAGSNVKTEQLEKMLDQPASKKKAKSNKEADAFWEEAVEKTGNIILDPDKLSYEQATQLGLTPDAKKK
ncbi:MAG: response regulator [Anaerolineales bacterium]|nr:response regulator [Anaerolineales bacterium]